MSRASKKLSWLLRHGAVEAGVAMDAAGWVDVADVLRVCAISEAELNEVVATNDKRRLQRDGSRIRCSQGHNRALPVTLEALEASWTPAAVDVAWHGTNLQVVDAIAAEGLSPMDRTHVHLAATVDSTVGKRAGVAVLLQIAPSRLEGHGLGLFVSPNGVLLVRRVPPDCITGVRPVTRRARAQADRLAGLFR